MASLFGGGGANPFANQHRDVLDAAPADEAGKQALTDELKSRAKGCMQQKNFPAAELLYGKAIEVNPNEATLLGNRSAARFGLGRFDAALEDAEAAIAADGSWAKGFFRKGQACNGLKRFADAAAAFEQGAALEPANKLFKSLASKAHEAAARQAEEQEHEPPPLEPAAAPAAAQAVRPAGPTPKPRANGTNGGGGATSDNTMRGYKLTSDGRKTTFFNRELDDEAKRLIGDITPAKVVPSAAPAAAATRATVEGSSAWNAAGTWEERTVTSWAKPRLEELLVGVEAPLPNGLGVVRTTKVKNLTGDASITMMRNKKKHLFDFSFAVDWSVMLLDEGPCKGTLTFPDVSPDCDGEYEALCEVDRTTPPAARALLDAYVKNPSQGLRPAICAAIQTFVDEFNAQQ